MFNGKLTGLSAFFPAYNEEANVERMVDAFQTILPQVAEDYEIIIVNDGSTDRTQKIADRLAQRDRKVQIVRHETNQGYGAAIRSGIRASQMDYLFFTDGDNQFDVFQLPHSIPLIVEYEGVIGFRINRQDPLIRKLNAWCWNRLVRFLFGLKVKDIDCAFKLFHRKIFEQIHLESSGAMISTEILVRIHRKGYRLHEIAVHHFPRSGGRQTGADFRVICRAFKELYCFYKKIKEEGEIGESFHPANRPLGEK